ncbi:abortive infection family protein [Variovorax sp. AFSI2.2]|uniref:abortive infection family protein n=1 Tax=Variovorax sp. AFSI2.2 TaxID=3384160 RepID=UPI003EBEEF0B
MPNQIPNSVIGAVSSVIAAHYYSHSKLDSLFLEAGAPGDVPGGNCESKCSTWLRSCNEAPDVDALTVLGRIIQPFMDIPEADCHPEVVVGQQRIRDALARNQLGYRFNGYISLAGASPAARTLADYLRAGDYASIDAEFDRALGQLDRDPHAAITAACSIIEAICKTCLDTLGVELPTSQTVVPLWRAVQPHLGLNMNQILSDDQKRILQGLASVVDGVGAYRTHIGSAHGRGVNPPPIDVSEARLAVNAAHTLVAFVMERWQAKTKSLPAPS